MSLPVVRRPRSRAECQRRRTIRWQSWRRAFSASDRATTGAVQLGIAGEEHLVTNVEFLSRESPPRRLVLVGVRAGRKAPDFEPLNLDEGDVQIDDGRLKLNEFLQRMSNPAVYAGGDAASRPAAHAVGEQGTERILGAHLVGPHAEEVINLFAVAIRHGLTATQLKSTIFAYPTSASDITHML